VVLVIIITIVITAYYGITSELPDVATWIVAGMFTFLFTLMGVALLSVITEDREYEEVDRFAIVASADSSLTSGRFSIFGGTVNEEPVFFYYSQQEGGSIRQGHVPASQSSIYEGGDGEVIVLANIEQRPASWWRFGFGESGRFKRQYEFHVPEGSVLQQHTFDLGKG
jgi:hypothetical protein